MPNRHAAAAVLITLSVVAATAVAKQKEGKKHGHGSAEPVDIVRLLAAPPAAGSAEARAELDAVLAVQASRTPADVARAKAEEKFDVFAFADVLGPAFTAERCPRTAEVFHHLEKQAKAACKVGKKTWDRRRPPYVDDRIKPVVELQDEGSYPSSHGARGQLYAEVLAAALPVDRRAALEPALLARGRQIGFDRVVGGVHYPSDVTAGRTVGHAIADGLLRGPAVADQLAAVRAELAALPGPAK